MFTEIDAELEKAISERRQQFHQRNEADFQAARDKFLAGRDPATLNILATQAQSILIAGKVG